MTKLSFGIIAAGLALVLLAFVGVDTSGAARQIPENTETPAPIIGGGSPWFIIAGLIVQMLGYLLMLRNRVMDKSKFKKDGV